MTDKTIDQLATELKTAEEYHEEMRKEASYARCRETDALNRLNAAQKALTARFDTLRKQAARDSEWGREKVKSYPVNN